jgi:predicted house-cleaning noncanonical NTP pyrophosphatase (MazG superfamily)
MAGAIVIQSGERKRGGSEMSKLVRDKIPDIIRESGETPITHKVIGVEFRAALIEKLYEEVEEFRSARDRDDIMAELADIKEVVNAIADTYGGVGSLEQIRLIKRRDRGGFSEGIIWEGNE